MNIDCYKNFSNYSLTNIDLSKYLLAAVKLKSKDRKVIITVINENEKLRDKSDDKQYIDPDLVKELLPKIIDEILEKYPNGLSCNNSFKIMIDNTIITSTDKEV